MNERITLDPNIAHGKPVIRGTRVPVARILGYLTASNRDRKMGLHPLESAAALRPRS